MLFANKSKTFPALLSGFIVLLIVGLSSCTNSASKTETKDTVSAPKDSSVMKMGTDTLKSDTSGKGGQPTPTGH